MYCNMIFYNIQYLPSKYYVLLHDILQYSYLASTMYCNIISGPPTGVKISGPVTVQGGKEYQYLCTVQGEDLPEITWNVKNYLGNIREDSSISIMLK